MSRGAALEDASRGRFADGAGLRADHRESGAVSVWQAGGELSGAGAVGGVERESAAAGTLCGCRRDSPLHPHRKTSNRSAHSDNTRSHLGN